MKNRYIFLLVIIAFVVGVVLSRLSLQSEITDTNQAVNSIQTHVQNITISLAQTRAIYNLEASLDAIGYIVALENKNAPRKHIGEEYTKIIKSRINALETIQSELKDAEVITKSQLLLENSKTLLAKIESSY